MHAGAAIRSPVEKGAKLLTLVLVRQQNRILLGKKKRGFGEGYHNGFGGKVVNPHVLFSTCASL